jgi:hypothetical protein
VCARSFEKIKKKKRFQNIHGKNNIVVTLGLTQGIGPFLDPKKPRASSS